MSADFANLVGYLATGVLLAAYLVKDHRALCIAISLGLTLFAGHYLLEGSVTTAVMLRSQSTPSSWGRSPAS